MNKILEYQKLDAEIYGLKRKISGLEERNIMNKMISYVKDAQNKTTQLEASAKNLLTEYTNLKIAYDNNYKAVQKLVKLNLEKAKEEDLQNAVMQSNTLSSDLFMIERNLNIVLTKMNEKIKEFEVTKNNAIKARTKHKENKIKYDEKVADIEPKIAELEAKLKALEPSIKPDYLAKYKALKADGIFPVFVPLLDKSCGACRMELPSNKIDKLKQSEYIVCEHCRRLIYNNK